MERISRSTKFEVASKNWFPITISINRFGPKIFHLFFATYLTLFAGANDKNCQTILQTLNDFNMVSGRQIKFAKSKVIFSMESYYGDLTIKANNIFGKYMRFPIFHKRTTHSVFQFIIDNMHIKLAS